MNDIIINKTSGGLGRREPSGDNISGLLANGVAVPGGVQLNTVYRLTSVKDVLALLINEAYDTDNEVLVYEHLNEMFRINPNIEVFLLLVDQALGYATMLDKAEAGNAKKLLIEAEGNIKQLAVAYNPAVAVADFTATIAAIAKAQELAIDEYNLHRPVDIILEGKGLDPTAPDDLRALNAENVSVAVGQAIAIANKDVGGSTPFTTYAAVGAVLGAISKAAVNQHIGWVDRFNLLGGNLQAASIGATSINVLTDAQKETLNDYGYIFFRRHTGIDGIYINESSTCTELESDFAYIENNRTIHKAVRSIRKALLPRLNAPVLVDQETGQLSPEVTKSIESDGVKALEEMQNSNEVSSLDVYVDPNQNILATSELQVQFSLVPTGTARKISVTIGFVNPF